MVERAWAVLCMMALPLPPWGHTSAVPLPAWGLWAMTLLAQCCESQPCHKWRAATLPQEIRQLTHILQCWSLCDLSMLCLVLCSEFTLLRHDKLTQVTTNTHIYVVYGRAMLAKAKVQRHVNHHQDTSRISWV